MLHPKQSRKPCEREHDSMSTNTTSVTGELPACYVAMDYMGKLHFDCLMQKDMHSLCQEAFNSESLTESNFALRIFEKCRGSVAGAYFL